mmetsp:Transcript_27210/g.83539  ORF Transcript_27210/g.83539 Transcript_27210/m.83539 type:complete len:265 (+) Transcript_27210:1023-1817(+)
MPDVDELRTSGNELFKAGKFGEAEAAYSAALEVEPENHLLLSNRSLARCAEKKYDEAIADARECLRVAPDFVKGFYRLANAQLGLGLLDEALATVRKGLGVDEDNAELKKLMRSIKAKRGISTKQGSHASSGVQNSKQQQHSAQRQPRQQSRSAEKQREIAEIAQTLRGHEAEKRDIAAQASQCRREVARTQLTATEVADLPDDTTLYRAVGKIFLQSTKPRVLDVLDADKSATEQRASSLAARLAFLDREIHSKEAELNAIAA